MIRVDLKEQEAEVASKELLTKEELEQIQGYTLALERAGVDNWEGYEYALEYYEEL